MKEKRVKLANPKSEITIRKTFVEDLDIFYQFHVNIEAIYQPYKQTDKIAFISKYLDLLNDLSVNSQTIIIDNVIVGSIGKFERECNAEITYQIDKNFWGRGIATSALKLFLNIEAIRPIYGRVAIDNIGSHKVLQKCGFSMIGTDEYFSNSRQILVQEIIYRLS